MSAQGNVAATYSYDAFGQLTAASENFGSGTTWTNPYRYDGRDGVRYDGETGLSWMSVRAYDPALGRFLSRDPLGRVPLFFADQPYVYGGNNPLSNVDPSGQFELTDGMSHVQARQARAAANQKYVKWYRMQSHPGKKAGLASLAKTGAGSCAPGDAVCQACNGDGQCRAQQLAADASAEFQRLTIALGILTLVFNAMLGPALGILTVAAEILNSAFGRESAYPSAWFTMKNISGFGSNDIAFPSIALLGTTMLAGLTVMAFFATFHIPGVSVPGIVVGAELTVAGFLSVGFLAKAMNYIYRQEALVNDGQAHGPPVQGPR